MTRRLFNELSWLGVALLGAGSVSRLTTGGASVRAALVTAFIGYVLAALLSIRFSVAASLLVGTLGVIISAAWNAVPSATLHGLPTPTTFRVLDHALRAVGGLHHLPIETSSGVAFVCALVSGIAAIATRVIPGALRILPALALLVQSVVAVASTGGAWLVVGFVVVAASTLLSQSARAVGWLVSFGVVIAASVCVIVVAVLTGSSATATSGGGHGVEGVPPSALALVSNLTKLESTDPNTVMFTASTSVSTYWQITYLSVLRGNTWVPDSATAAAIAGRDDSAATQAPIEGPTFAATVTVANLSSRLLPVPPTAIRASLGASSPAGFVQTQPTTPLETYSVTAELPGAVPSDDTGGAGSSAFAVPVAGLATYTSLPSLPPVVDQIARAVTSAGSTTLQKAEALTNWFRSGLFHYSLRSSPSLTAFLTTSRSGSCEQFAGAFAVLARAVGLPTRIAVGFTTGLRDTAGRTVIRGIDAHAWPEVLVGNSWISFEPTPQLPSGELSPPGVIGQTGLGTPNPVGPVTVPTSIPHITLPSTPVRTTSPKPSGGVPVWLWLYLPAASVAVSIGVLILLRRRHGGSTSNDALVDAWRRVDVALERRHLGRPASRTPTAHARSLRNRGRGEVWGSVVNDIESLANSLERSSYGAEQMHGLDASQADELSRRISKLLRIK